MAYGTLKCDNIVFDNGGTDKLLTVSGLFFSTSGALTVTGAISGGNVTAPTATFTTLTGTTTAGTTATFTSGSFTSLTGVTTTITSGIFGAGSATAPSVAVGTGTTYKPGIYSPGADQLAVSINGTERITVDGSGRLLVGTSTARSNFFGTTLSAVTQTEGTGGAIGRGSLSVINNDVSNNPPYVLLGRSGAATLGSNATVISGSRLGTLTFHGADGTSFIEAATVAGEVDGTPGASDMPGRLVFSTTADGAASPTERMRITNGGGVCFATTAVGVQNSDSASFNTAGYITVNHINGKGSGSGYVAFNYNGGEIGSITQNGTTGVAYNTSSDYRLKENILPITNGITRFQQLKPSRFNFKADPGIVMDGFLAHEAQAVVPECVTGEKDAVDADGNPVYQGIDQSKLVPLLTAALQEAIARIETLETRLSALEGA